MIKKSILFVALLLVLPAIPLGHKGTIQNACAEVTYRTHGLNFSPYIGIGEDPNKGVTQITDEELEARLDSIAVYTDWIRTFGCNDDLREAGIYTHARGLHSAVGAWLGSDPVENDNQIACLLDQARHGYVDIAIVGSEVLLRGDLSESVLLGYINQVKDSLQSAGIDIPVTYADVHGVLLDHPNVVSTIDIVFVNYYPYWEGRSVELAVAYIHRWHQQMISAAGGKEVIVSETGWPSCGDQIGEAVPSTENAAFFFLNFISWARANNVKYIYFEAYDEGWKADYEGPQGACWGIWDSNFNMKSEMYRIFAGDTIEDNWSAPLPDAPIIEFADHPAIIETNIPTFIVAGHTTAGNEIQLNGDSVSTSAIDTKGNYAFEVPLTSGDNIIQLLIKTGDDTVTAAEKTIRFDETFSTASRRLLYVNSISQGDDVPSLPGTIVIDLDGNALLGLIENKYVVGISPDGTEIYTSDRSAISTDTHQQTRTLSFSQDIPYNGYLVSPDGEYLYSRNERLHIQSNTLGANLPSNIVTGSCWCSAQIPGGPAITRDGRFIYCGNSIARIALEANSSAGIGISGLYMSDIELAPALDMILISEYSYAAGRLDIYDRSSGAHLATMTGLGDFAGEIRISKDGRKAIVGSSGNASWADGRVSVIDLTAFKRITQVSMPLADNIATSGENEFFVSSGSSGLFSRLGIDMFVLGPTGSLVRTKTFFLGINGQSYITCRPEYNQIRRIIYKCPPPPVPEIISTDMDTVFMVDTPVHFSVHTTDEYSHDDALVLEYLRSGYWIQIDTLTPLPDAAQEMRLTCVFDKHFGRGEWIFRAVFDCANGSRAFSEPVRVISDLTHVLIEDFLAEFDGADVQLSWKIGGANLLHGFNIYKSEQADAHFFRINDELIPADCNYEYNDSDIQSGKTYWYYLGAIDNDGEVSSSAVSVDIPKAPFFLYQNHPNPFNPSTTISFNLPSRGRVELSIYTLEGKLVVNLVDCEMKEGLKQIKWDGTDARGKAVDSGIYFYRLKFAKKVLSKKLVLIR